jgi:ABC-type spermidine/putrescine transport system permease subunit II
MIRTLLGAFCGLIVGAALGCLLAYVIHRIDQKEADTPDGWMTYPTIANPTGGATISQFQRVGPTLSYLIFQGILYGGGCGSVVGAVAFATGTMLRAMQEQKQVPGGGDSSVR